MNTGSVSALVSALVVSATLILPRTSEAAPLKPDEAPAPLQPWIEWVTHDLDWLPCPMVHGTDGDRRCEWPSRLALELSESGGRFEQEWLVQRRAWVALPGDLERWPQTVRVDGAPAVVVPRDGRPHVVLTPGAHTMSGRFSWDTLPEKLQVPPATGLLQLTLRGEVVPFPQRDEQGQLWLQKQGETSPQENRLEVLVHRRLVDEIPFLLITRIELEVSGESREELLGKALPAPFVAMALSSPLPARLEPDGRLRVQVRPGTWVIELTARHDRPLAALSLAGPDGPWSAQEIWVFDARPDLRLVDVGGAPSIDPQQTRLPEPWRQLPAFRLVAGATLELVERRRGEGDPPADELRLERTLWLDFDGKGLTARDVIRGSLHQSWRLTMRRPLELGRVAVNRDDQFITRLDESGDVGVELRRRTLRVEADSRLRGRVSKISAVGWDHDFDAVSAELRLPPGWRLLHATGVDEANTTWLKSWTLLDLFVVLLVVAAIFKLWGWGWALLALVTLVLSWQEPGAPQWSWPALLVAETLVRLLPLGRPRNLAKLMRIGCVLALLSAAIPFVIQQARQGLYPSLEFPWQSVSDHLSLLQEEAPPPPPPMDPLEQDKFGELLDEMELEKDGRDDEQEPPPPKPDVAGGAAVLLKPVPSGVEIQIDGDMKLPIGVSKRDERTRHSGLRGKAGYRWRQKASMHAFDPKAVVQTGPGLPSWAWNAVSLEWSGPVERGQEVGLWLLGPVVNGVIAFVRLLLVALLALCVLGFPGRFWPGLLTARHGAHRSLWLIPLLFALLPSTGVRAAESGSTAPSAELLAELRERLAESPDCVPACASSSRAVLEVTGGSLRLRLELEAAIDTAVPVPASAAQWMPERTLLDAVPARGLARTDDGALWLFVPAGQHQVVLEGRLPRRETVQLPLPLKPHRVEVRAAGWSVEGLHEDGLADDVLQLTRQRAEGEVGAALEASNLPPFVRVERALWLGLSWQVETRVVRLTPLGSAVVIEVPLLPGESVTSAGVRVEKGRALVNMAPQAGEVSWSSVLEQRDRLTLKAPKEVPWAERWLLEASPIWHLQVEGIPTVHHAEGGSRKWRPWPGEQVTAEVTRPEGIAGQTLTVDHTAVEVTPGLRATDVTLSLVLRSSRGGQHRITLPERAKLQETEVNGKTQPARQDGRVVTLSLSPGRQGVKLSWRQPEGVAERPLLFRTPEIDVGAPATNVETRIDVPRSRWILLVQPSQLGPAVLFWSMMLVLLIGAVALGRVRLTPLRWYHWFLLGVGLSQATIWVVFLVAGWLLVLGWRGERTAGSDQERWWWFDLRQLLLAGWTAAALIALFVSVAQGLLGSPDMQIMGNSSSRALLRWYLDRSASALPRPWVVSVPLWLYRGLMLAWALWLAIALLRWLRWGWSCFGRGGLWRSAPKVIVPPQSPEPPSPTAPSGP